MDGIYFHERLCVLLAQLGGSMLSSLTTHPPTYLVETLDALEYGHSSSDPLAISTHKLVGELVEDLLASIVIDCMENPKAKRRRETQPLDYMNMHIHKGYTNETYILCGGVETKKLS